MYLLAALTLGFLGSFHCVGMCGPIALALPLNRKNYFTMISGGAAYNAGRLFTYALVGLVFGLIGQGLHLTGYQNILSISLGSIIILIVLLSYTKWIRLNSSGIIGKLIQPIKSMIGSLFKRTSPVALFSIGVLNGFLPCGLVYTAIAGALAVGSVFKGSLFMIAFGAGTVPAMMALHFIGNSISISFRNKIRKAVPVFVMIMGLMLVVRGMNLGIPYLSPETKVKAEGETTSCVHECCKPE